MKVEGGISVIINNLGSSLVICRIYHYFLLSGSPFYPRTKFILEQILIVSVVLNRTS
jgi:hypothetical protein